MRASVFLLLCICLPGCSRQAPATTATAEPETLESLTRAHTRVTWIRQVVGEGSDPFAMGDHFVLMGLDSRDGRGERAILDSIDNYRKPLLTADGERVVYTDLPDLSIHVVNWDGTGHRRVGAGMGVELWRDPVTGTEWVYFAASHRTNVTLDAVGLMRMALDAPQQVELVWDQTDVTPDNFQLSADGTRAAGLFPWKQWSILDLKTGTLTPQGKGCWTSMAPDNSYACWVFDGAHKNVLLKRPGASDVRRIPLNRAPGVNGHEVYHPRWSNQVRYFAMTGPYKVMGRYNAITGGGTGINLHLGRFSDDLTRVEAWVQVTDHPAADIFPDVWIAGPGVAVTPIRDPDVPGPQPPVSTASLHITGQLVEITETPSVEAIRPYTSTLVEYVYDVVLAEQGTLESDRIIVQHWGIRDRAFVELNQELGSRTALTLQTVAANPWLQGERVSSTIDDITLDVYLDVGVYPPPDE